MRTYTADCPCWHWFYDREAKEYKERTAEDCSVCGGSGQAEWVAFDNPKFG